MSEASTTQSTYIPGEGPLGETMSVIKTLVDTSEMEATLGIRYSHLTDLDPEGYKAENVADQLLTKLALKQVSRKIGMDVNDKKGDGYYNVSVRLPQSLVESSGLSLEDLADEGACEIGKLRALGMLCGSRDGLTVLQVQERLTETFVDMLISRLRDEDTRNEWRSAYLSVPRQQLLDDFSKIEGGNRKRHLERTAQGKKPSGGSRILPTFTGLSRRWLGTHHGGKTVDSVNFEPLDV
jgi:hypothetical protein